MSQTQILNHVLFCAQPGDVHANSVAETNGEPPERIPRQKKRKDFFGNIKRR